MTCKTTPQLQYNTNETNFTRNNNNGKNDYNKLKLQPSKRTQHKTNGLFHYNNKYSHYSRKYNNTTIDTMLKYDNYNTNSTKPVKQLMKKKCDYARNETTKSTNDDDTTIERTGK